VPDELIVERCPRAAAGRESGRSDSACGSRGGADCGVASPSSRACLPSNRRPDPTTTTTTSRTGPQHPPRTTLNAGQRQRQPPSARVGQVLVDGQVYAQPLSTSRTCSSRAGASTTSSTSPRRNDKRLRLRPRTRSRSSGKRSFINPGTGRHHGPPRASFKHDPRWAPRSAIVGHAGDRTHRPICALRSWPRRGRCRSSASTNVQRLHAIDLGTGREALGGPVNESRPTVRGTGHGLGRGARSSFQRPLGVPKRPGLLLSNGVVYIAWGPRRPTWGRSTAWGHRLQTATPCAGRRPGNNTPKRRGGGHLDERPAPPATDAGREHLHVLGQRHLSAPTSGKGVDYGDKRSPSRTSHL